jgi:hypothetical protein
MTGPRRPTIAAALFAGTVFCAPSYSAWASSTLLTSMTGEGGKVLYDFTGKPGNGWYVESGSAYRFKLGFKQGERGSPQPIEVSTVTVDPHERYNGTASIALQIIARSENRPRSTAYYKVSVSSVKPGDPVKLPVRPGENFVQSFAMKIDPKFSIEDGAPIIFEQFWQGSPFSAPVSLTIVSPADAKRMNWPDVGPRGNFSLKINNDDHAPLHSFRTKTLSFDLGPITLGEWMTWKVHVIPSPRQAGGMVQVFLDGKQVADLTDQKIGFDRDNPEYSKYKPSTTFDDVDILLYRKNGPSFQRFYFDDVNLSIDQ